MAISLFAAQAEGPNLISLDDQAVLKDLTDDEGVGGTDYTPFLLSTLIGLSSVGVYAKLRRMIQRVTHEGAVTIDVTPWRDGVDTGQTITRDLTSMSRPLIVVPLAVTGDAFQLRIALSDFDAPAALGSGEFTVLERRSSPGGSPIVGSESA